MDFVYERKASSETPDVVGIGALNVDFIAPFSKLKSVHDGVIQELRTRFDHGSERGIETQDLNPLLDRLSLWTSPYPGGSAFNAIHCIGALRADVTAGYVSVAGSTSDVDFSEYFADYDIDGRFVPKMDTPARRCLSYTEYGKRTLRTELMEDNRGKLAEALHPLSASLEEYLSKIVRIIHVTSLTNDADTQFICDMVLKVRRQVPAIRLSVDPGMLWVEAARANEASSEVLSQLLAQADFLFLNQRESEILAALPPMSTTTDVAGKLLPGRLSRQRLLILKRYQGTELFTRLGRQVFPREYRHNVISKERIEDTTGAGDVFAGAFLTGAVLGLDHSERCALAARAVGAKLLGPGCTPYRQFSSLLTLQRNRPSSGNDARRPRSVPSTVYNFFDPVTSVQTGRASVAIVVQDLEQRDRQALVTAMQGIQQAIHESAAINPHHAELRDVARECEELVKDKSANNTKLMAMFQVLVTCPLPAVPA